MELGTTHGSEVVSIGNSDVKSEDSCFEDKIWVSSSGVCFGGSGEGSPLVE